jgi:hypothetical protein
MAIDNPLDQIRNITNEEEADPFGGFLQLGGVAHPLFAVAAVVNSVLDVEQRRQRIRATLRALCDELERVQESWPKDIEKAIKSDWFKRTIQTLIEESARSTNDDRARLFARVAARGCFPSGLDAHRQEDLANYIRDLAALGEDDIQMLKLLGVSYRETKIKTPNLHDPNYFTQHYMNFRGNAEKLKIHLDDRLSIGARLSGFGLAILSPISATHDDSQQFYRPSLRGFYLLSLLEAADLPVEQQN